MSDDQFTKLFKYMTKRFDSIEEQLAKKADRDEVLTRLDGIASRLDKDDAERTALSNQVDRHDNWIKKLANKTDTKLSYE